MCVFPCMEPNTTNISYRFKASIGGVDTHLATTRGPFCLVHAEMIARQSREEQNQELILRLTRGMVKAGYSVDMTSMEVVLMPVDEPRSVYAEYVPREGYCHHPDCIYLATVKPVVIIPILNNKNSEMYIQGPGFCDDHIKGRLDLSKCSMGDIKAAMIPFIQSGLHPLLSQARVEARLIEWQPEGVIITEQGPRRRGNANLN